MVPVSSNVLHSSSLLLKVIWRCSTSLLLNQKMVPLYGFSIIIWFHYMVSQSSYGSIIWFLNHHMVPLYGFSIIIWFPLYGFSIIIWFHLMVSQSSYGSIIWFLNHHMVPLYGFSIIIWYPKIWFLNQNLVNYMFSNRTSAFSRYPAADFSKCISATDSSCFRAQCKGKSRERWYYTEWIP